MKILHLVDERWDSGLTAYAIQSARLQHEGGEFVVMGVREGKPPETLAKRAGLTTAPVNRFGQLRRLLTSNAWDIVNVHTGRVHTWSVLLTHPVFRFLGLGVKRAYAVVRTRGDAREVRADPLTRFVYRRTGAVITASDHIAKQYAEKFPNRADVTVIYPSIDADATIAPVSFPTVGIVGRLDPVKGHSSLLDAAAIVRAHRPDVRFSIAGKEAGISVALLKNQVQTLGLEANVTFSGYVASARDFMRGCSVGVIASHASEEISRACLEWMSVGRPVVGTLVGCLPELIETGETGLLVPPGDAAALAEALLTLLSNPHQAEQWGRRGWERIRRSFSSEQERAQAMDVYRAALTRITG